MNDDFELPKGFVSIPQEQLTELKRIKSYLYAYFSVILDDEQKKKFNAALRLMEAESGQALPPLN